MTGGPKVTVAGAGALGWSAALALADAGASVTVCDPSGAGLASSVAAGMLAPVFEAVLEPETAPAFDILLAARDLWPGLEARAGVALDRAGALAVGEADWLAGINAGLIRLGVHGIDLPRRTAEDMAPGLSEGFGRALLVREDWRLEPVAALSALRGAALAAGVEFREARVDTAGEADWLVLATGADPALAEMVPELALLTPVKGQIARYPNFRGPALSVRGQGAYVVPGEGGAAVGATMEAGLADPTPNPRVLKPLIKAAERLFPALEGASSQVSAGLRAATPDGLPMVGFSWASKVILATGARRNGWLLGPLVGEIVAACVTGRDAGPYAARLDPRRFG